MARRSSRSFGPLAGGGGAGRAALKGLLVLLAVAGAGAGVAVGFAHLARALRDAPEYQMSRESLRLVEGPAWMTPAIRAELDVTAALPPKFSVLDPALPQRVARAYQSCLWVERVESVRVRDVRVAGGPPLEVRLKFRRPVAFVEVGVRDGYCLVDARGVRLPGTYREPRLGDVRFLLITGCTQAPPAPGQVWSAAALEAAVRVAEAVEPKREKFGLATLDVSNFGGRRDPRDPEIALWTVNRTEIKWGRAPTPEAERLQEKSLAEKVGYLDYVYEAFQGRVDGVLEYIDIPNEAVGRRAAPERYRLRS